MKKKPYIEPCNPYTGNISVLAIMANLENGYTKFPRNMGTSLFKRADPYVLNNWQNQQSTP